MNEIRTWDKGWDSTYWKCGKCGTIYKCQYSAEVCCIDGYKTIWMTRENGFKSAYGATGTYYLSWLSDDKQKQLQYGHRYNPLPDKLTTERLKGFAEGYKDMREVAILIDEFQCDIIAFLSRRLIKEAVEIRRLQMKNDKQLKEIRE